MALTLPRPDSERLAEYYHRHYYRTKETRRFPAPVELFQRLLYRHRARRVELLAGGRPGHVLDVGCGPGFLLAAFRRRGWEVQGVELSDESSAHSRDVLGIPVHVGAPVSWAWPEGYFDAVVMWHSLEHLPDPRQMLMVLARLLRPGGVVMVGVPNFGSSEARFFRDDWFHLDVPRHLYHFTPVSLRSVLADSGFQVRRCSFFAPEYDVFSFVQSIENRLGLGRNLLYDLLRSRGRSKSGALRLFLALVLAGPLALVGFPITALLAWLGRGSSMALFAVKL